MRPRLTEAQLASELDTSQQSVNAWIKERWAPSPEKKAAIAKLYPEVPVGDWDVLVSDDPKPKRKAKTKRRRVEMPEPTTIVRKTKRPKRKKS